MTTFIKTLALAALLLTVPALSSAATFGYVNNNDELSVVTADNALQALATAPNMHIHSGVILLDSPEDNALFQK